MDTGTTVAIAVACGTSLLTVTLFVVSELIRRRAKRIDERHAAVLDVIRALQRSVRESQSPRWFRIWKRIELEFALEMPRLLVSLQKADDPVGRWAVDVVQQMQDATTEKRVVALGLELTLRLAEWHRGDKPTSWFDRPLVLDDVKPPSRYKLRARKALSLTGRLLAEGLGITAITAALRWIWEETSPKELRKIFSVAVDQDSRS